MWSHALLLTSIVLAAVGASSTEDGRRSAASGGCIEDAVLVLAEVPTPKIPPAPPKCDFVVKDVSGATCASGKALYKVCSDGSETFLKCR